MTRPWDDHYRAEETPWDSGRPEPLFEQAITNAVLPKSRLLEIGCGTGANARLFSHAGYDVVAVDLSPTAIEKARSHPEADGIEFVVRDVMADGLPAGPFDAVIDRGCFHTFQEAEEQHRFAALVAGALRVGGCWLSLIGSTEGAAREVGPPRRTARDVILAIEPELELVELRADHFSREDRPAVWWCLSRKRAVPAQPSTRH